MRNPTIQVSLILLFMLTISFSAWSQQTDSQEFFIRPPSLAAQLFLLERVEQINPSDSRSLLERYMSHGDDDWQLGLSLVLADPSSPDAAAVLTGYGHASHNNASVNHSLYLLIQLLEAHPSWHNDSILLAMAIANNYLYALADQPTRAAILEDIEWHLGFYNQVLAHQKTLPFALNLAEVPVIAKVFWCDRYQHMDTPPGGRLTLAHYREFISTPQSLQAAFDFFTGLPLPATVSFKEFAAWMEFQINKRNVRLDHISAGDSQYRTEPTISKEEKDRFTLAIRYYERYYINDRQGQKRDWGDNAWLNRQMDLFAERQGFLGDCVTTSLMMRTFYACFGIPAVNFRLQAIPEGSKTYSHNFPLFYNSFTKRFDCVQIPAFWMKEYALYFTKPIWNHLLHDSAYYYRENNLAYNPFYPGEVSDTLTVTRLLQSGIGLEQIYRLVLTGDTHKPGLFFPRPASAISARDTDGDGLSDLWEIEHGYDPERPDRRESIDTRYVPDWYRLPLLAATKPAATITDPPGDCKGNTHQWDISTVSIYQTSLAFLLLIDFHSPVTDHFLLAQSLNVYNSDSQDTYFLQWDQVPYEGRFYKRVDGQLETVAVPFHDMPLWRYGSRLAIGLRKDLFGQGRSIKFRYYSSAMDEQQNYIIAADSSDWLTVAIK